MKNLLYHVITLHWMSSCIVALNNVNKTKNIHNSFRAAVKVCYILLNFQIVDHAFIWKKKKEEKLVSKFQLNCQSILLLFICNESYFDADENS